ncbi:thioesterase II family protein [Streptomyces sp. CJ_13]|uniref:thioesterase II family protein n=1 Tax=Streptomyces sp. CJ_13 TaxID=2724943 RepID=UPI00202A680E|nr:alpha/beta fold hydrolase [Streptomyces sp. CJ_13]
MAGQGPPRTEKGGGAVVTTPHGTRIASQPRLLSRAAEGPPRYRLVCLPHAGGGAASFTPWLRGMPPDVEVHSVRLPGRESRMSDPPHRHFAQAVSELLDLLGGWAPIPWALYGHSMGGLLAYELYHALTEAGLPDPLSLAVGATTPPQRWVRTPRKLRDGYSREELVGLLRHYGGAPTELFDNAELLEVVLPAVEADFLMLDGYRPTNTARPVRCPLLVFAGSRDPAVVPDDIAAWRELAAGPFEYRLLESAGHFFASSHTETLMTILDARTRERIPLERFESDSQ